MPQRGADRRDSRTTQVRDGLWVAKLFIPALGGTNGQAKDLQ